jgi:nucleotide-binding universal stress UspA family protein
LANAVELTRIFGGHLIVLTVVPTLTWLSKSIEARHFPEEARVHRNMWREEFDRFLTSCDIENVSWESELRVGAPHEEIVLSASQHSADLIVMGSTGRSGLARILMGSVTRRVIQQLPCSLLIVKQQNALEELHEYDVQTIKVLYAQGQALLAARSAEAALEKFSHVLVRDPFHLGALAGKAAACEALGRTADAERWRRRATLIAKNDEVPCELGVAD